MPLVKLEEEEFQQAMRRLAREVRLSGTPRQTVEKLFEMDPQFGNYLWLEQDQKLVPLGPGERFGKIRWGPVAAAARARASRSTTSQ